MIFFLRHTLMQTLFLCNMSILLLPIQMLGQESTSTFGAENSLQFVQPIKQIRQGHAFRIRIQSTNNKTIRKAICINGSSITSFFPSEESNTWETFVGLHIRHPIGLVTIRAIAMFEDGEMNMISKKIKILPYTVSKPFMRIRYRTHRRILKKYKNSRGKIYRRWKRVPVYRYKKIWIPKAQRKNIEMEPENLRQVMIFEFADEYQKYNQNQFISGLQSIWSNISFSNLTPNNKITQKQPACYLPRNFEKYTPETKLFMKTYHASTATQYWTGNFIWPIKPNLHKRISTHLGQYRILRIKGKRQTKFHTGIDIVAKLNTPIYAINSGKVELSNKFRFRGNAVLINHGQGIHSLYYHLNKLKVRQGMFVRKGQIIGFLGSTGNSTGPHLHFEIRVGGISVNTLDWFNQILIWNKKNV